MFIKHKCFLNHLKMLEYQVLPSSKNDTTWCTRQKYNLLRILGGLCFYTAWLIPTILALVWNWNVHVSGPSPNYHCTDLRDHLIYGGAAMVLEYIGLLLFPIMRHGFSRRNRDCCPFTTAFAYFVIYGTVKFVAGMTLRDYYYYNEHGGFSCRAEIKIATPFLYKMFEIHFWYSFVTIFLWVIFGLCKLCTLM